MTLVVGTGMCLAMQVIGFAGVAVNYPIYKKIRERMNKAFLELLEEKDFAFIITPEQLKAYLAFVKEHTGIFRLALEKSELLHSRCSFERLFEQIFSPIMSCSEIIIGLIKRNLT